MCSVQTGDSSKKAKLANAFAVKAGQICSEEKREVMQKWLEDSFDSRVEIEEIVKKAPVDEVMVWGTLIWTQVWNLQGGSC